MEQIEVKVQPIAKPYNLMTYYRGIGTIAINCTPMQDGEGVYLWRPFLTNVGKYIGTDTILRLFKFKDKLWLIATDAGKTKLFLIEAYTYNALTWDLPYADEWDFEVLAGAVVFAIAGKGVWQSNYDEVSGSFLPPVRLGSLISFQPNNFSPRLWSSATDDPVIMTIDWSDTSLIGKKAFISNIVFYMAMKRDAEEQFKLELELLDSADNVIASSVNTIYTDGLMPYSGGGTTIWTPVSFQFMQEVELPFKIRLKPTYSTKAEVYFGLPFSSLEAGVGISYAFTPKPPPDPTFECGVQVSGIFSPNGGVIGVQRGMLFVKHKGSRMHIGNILNGEFTEEVVFSGEIKVIDSSKDSLYVLTDREVLALTGWTAKGVQMNKVLSFGIEDRRDVATGNKGLYVKTGSGIWRVVGLSSQAIPILKANYWPNEHLAFLSEAGVLLIYSNDDLVLAYYEDTELTTFWRFDEIDSAYGYLPDIKDVNDNYILFWGGEIGEVNPAYTSAGLHTSEVYLITDLVPERKLFEVHYLELEGNYTKYADGIQVLGVKDDVIDNTEGEYVYLNKSITVFSIFNLLNYNEFKVAQYYKVNLGFPQCPPSAGIPDPNYCAGLSNFGVIGRRFVVYFKDGANAENFLKKVYLLGFFKGEDFSNSSPLDILG